MARSVFVAIAKMEQKDLRGILYQYYVGVQDDMMVQYYGPSYKDKIKEAIAVLTSKNEIFTEDRYAYLYSTYKITRTDFNGCFNPGKYVFRYLKSRYQAGTAEFQLAVSDPNVTDDLKDDIKQYFKGKENVSKISSSKEKSASHYKKSKAVIIRDPAFISIKKNAETPIKESAYRRLKQRILKEFNTKFYVGDIRISDADFKILTAYSSVLASQIVNNKVALTDKPLFAVTLVHIGIRYYDGSYWPHVGKILKIPVPAQIQKLIGDSCTNTFKAHEKIVLGDSEKVKSILLHCFVSDFYSKGLYELLFQYYRNDLERDINRNTPDQMRSLMDTLAMNAELSDEESESFTDQFMGKGSRAYKLRNHTLRAMTYQPSQSMMRLRRLLRLIDKAFWKNQLPKKPISRLTVNFVSWVNESESFRQDHNLYVRGEIRNRGKKHFSTPYLFADLNSNSFSLKLPAQIVAGNEEDVYSWKVISGLRNSVVEVESYRVLTGRKTKESEIHVSNKELFNAITCELFRNDEKVKVFSNIPTSKARLFDTEGDYASKIFKIPMIAFSLSGTKLISPALTYNSTVNDFERWEFSFQDGDLLILPDGESLVAGEKIAEGFTHRGRIDNVTYVPESKIPVYSQAPDLVLQVEKSKIQGTVFEVNGEKHRLSECEYTCFSTADTKNQNAVLIRLDQFSQSNLQVNKIYIDIPGSYYSKEYAYLLIERFSLEYTDSPYVFDNRGAVVFPGSANVRFLNPVDTEKINGENGFAFDIVPELPSVEFLVENQIHLSSVIPVFCWSTDNENWQLTSMGEIWHTDFFKNNKLFIRSPESRIELFTEDDGEDEDLHSVSAEKIGEGRYVLELTRFHSWINRDRVKHDVYLKLGKNEYPFAQVYARGIVTSFAVQPNYEEDILTCNYDIIGKSDCYLDIVHASTGQKLVEKASLSDKQFVLHDKLKNGRYFVEVFEAEEDESGFDMEYHSIYKNGFILNNVNDLSGQHLSIEKIKFPSNQVSFVTYSSDISYWIKNLDKKSHNVYIGNLVLNGENLNLQVKVEFSDTDNRYFQLSFWDDFEEDYLEFMLDWHNKTLVKEEEPNLRPSVKYTRYRILYPSDYVYFGQLYDTFQKDFEQYTD